MYIGKSACISYQNTIEEGALSLKPIAELEELKLQEPAYKTVIKPALLRRMSTVLKMGTHTAITSLAENSAPEAIIVGTGLGCVRDTLSFLDQAIQNDEQTLAPTAFIQSTHNSIGGQIALLLQNNCYNMTVAQHSLSFEMALLDAQLQLTVENLQHVLVGGVDELTPTLENLLTILAEKYGISMPVLGQGSAFFNITKEPTSDSIARVQQIKAIPNFNGNDIDKLELNLKDYDLILNGGVDPSHLPQQITVIDFKDYCGEYFTASAFAMHLALLAFQQKLTDVDTPERIVILNTFGGNFGAIGLERCDL